MTHPSDEDRPVDPTIDPDIIPPEPRTGKVKKEDRRVVSALVEEPEEDEPEEEVVLTPEERKNFERAITIGRRIETVTVADCKLTIQTLKGGDEMRIGLYTKPYLDTQGFARAFQIGTCAASILEIKGPYGDDQPLWESLTEVKDPDVIFRKNCQALEEFRPIMLSKIYEAIRELERKDSQLGIKLGKY